MAIDQARVAYVPGAAFYPDRSGHNTLRLSFTLNEAPVVAEAIRRLAEMIKLAQAGQGESPRGRAVNES